jgi:CspA family cold shock protein
MLKHACFFNLFRHHYHRDDRLSERLLRPKGSRTTPKDLAARFAAIVPRNNWKEDPGMPTGTVKWFNATKGYGFIAPDDGGKDVFVHISAVERAGLKGLNDNQKIGYELQSGRDGRSSASDLKLL